MTETFPITIDRVAASRLPQIDFSDLKFGRIFTDHMFVAQYHDGQWQESRIMPYGPMSFEPSMSALHYGQAIFEGMKAYRGQDGKVRLFRAEENMRRLNHSAERMAMPPVPEELFMNGLRELISLDRDWVPANQGSSLYIRPFMFATDTNVGVRISDSYLFVIFCCPVNAYYTEPVRVKIETHYVRSAPGGTGSAKSAGNYGGSLYPSGLAQKEGYHQLLWTDSLTHSYFEESGTMNVFFMLNDTLVTPALSDTILSGVTRDSIIKMARHWGMPVEERRVSVTEVVNALEAGQLQDAFGAGTAATVAPIATIGFEGTDFDLPGLSQRPFIERIRKELDDIRYGRSRDIFGWMSEV